METKIQKWGNSLAFRIPKKLAEDSNLEEGAVVELRLEKKKLVIKRKFNKKPTLKKLLSGVTEKNIHKEQDFGKPAGRELL